MSWIVDNKFTWSTKKKAKIYVQLEVSETSTIKLKNEELSFKTLNKNSALMHKKEFMEKVISVI